MARNRRLNPIPLLEQGFRVNKRASLMALSDNNNLFSVWILSYIVEANTDRPMASQRKLMDGNPSSHSLSVGKLGNTL